MEGDAIIAIVPEVATLLLVVNKALDSICANGKVAHRSTRKAVGWELYVNLLLLILNILAQFVCLTAGCSIVGTCDIDGNRLADRLHIECRIHIIGNRHRHSSISEHRLKGELVGCVVVTCLER